MADTPTEVPTPPSRSGIAVRSGVDVVSIDRIEGLLAEFGESFRTRVYRSFEREYCDRQADPAQHYAARWAVKEAFLKAIATDAWPVPLRDIGVARDDGQPSLALTERAVEALDATMATDRVASLETAVSLSHDRHADRAIGQVVFVGK